MRGLAHGISLLFSIGVELRCLVADSILLIRTPDFSLIRFACNHIVGILDFMLGPIQEDSGSLSCFVSVMCPEEPLILFACVGLWAGVVI